MLFKFRRSKEVVPVTPPTFSLPNATRVYAVGDIHGRSHLLIPLLKAIQEDARANPIERVIEVFLGDYVDRGMHSREVLHTLMQPPVSGHERVCLRGNHEAALLAFLADPLTLREWGNFGGYATLASYGVAIPRTMQLELLRNVRDQFQTAFSVASITFLRQLSHYYILGDYLFVHAGILPGIKLEDQSRETMLRVREPFLSHAGFHPFYVVHGHTPVWEPQILANRANLDVSDSPEDKLACLVLEGESKKLIQVNAKGETKID